MDPVNISLNQLKTLMNYTGNGMFATRAEKTSGMLQLDASGKLENVNRHWYNSQTVCTDGQRNMQLRRALLDTFSANGASQAFLADLRERLGLSADLFSNGRTDAQGEAMSSKPLERREIKQIITAFEQERKATESNLSEQDRIARSFAEVGVREVKKRQDELGDWVVLEAAPREDPMAQNMSRMKAAGEAFLADLSQKLEENGLLPKTSGNTDICALYMNGIRGDLACIADEVVEGRCSVPAALERLAGRIESAIGSTSVGERNRRSEESMCLRTVIYDALDGFARKLGVEGKHPFETALRENYQTRVLNEFLAKPFPEGKSARQKLAFLLDFAERVNRISQNTIFLNNRSRLHRGAGEESHPSFFENTIPSIALMCREQKSAFGAFLKRFTTDGTFEMELREAIRTRCNEMVEANLTTGDAYDDASIDLSDATSALNKKLVEMKNAREAGVNAERLKTLDQELATLERDVNEAREKLAVLVEPRMVPVAIQALFAQFGLLGLDDIAERAKENG